MKKTILIVDSRPQMLAALAELFSEYQTETMQSATGALNLINTRETPPDLCILNIYSPHDPNISRLAKELRDREIPVVFLGAEERHEEDDKKTVTSYAGDLVTRPFDLPELLRRIDHLLKPVEIPTATLTERQIEILSMIVRGLPDQEIAQLLNVSTQTVRWHLTCAAGRLGAKNRNHLIAIAVSRGMVKLD